MVCTSTAPPRIGTRDVADIFDISIDRNTTRRKITSLRISPFYVIYDARRTIAILRPHALADRPPAEQLIAKPTARTRAITPRHRRSQGRIRCRVRSLREIRPRGRIRRPPVHYLFILDGDHKKCHNSVYRQPYRNHDCTACDAPLHLPVAKITNRWPDHDRNRR